METITEEQYEGLLLLGWQFHSRLTTEDISLLCDIGDKAYDLEKTEKLTDEYIDRLSFEAFKVLEFQSVNIQELSDLISLCFINSENFRPIISLLDEAIFCFQRGYYFSSLSTLLIALENYLRKIYNWNPGDNDPSFKNLKDAVKNLPNRDSSIEAQKILDTLYSRYNGLSPTMFQFNRHGVLHGISGRTGYEKMNCVRIINLFKLLFQCEDAERTGYGNYLTIYNTRFDLFSKSEMSQYEQELLLNPKYSDINYYKS